MNLRKHWGRHLATYVGRRWATLNLWSHGDGGLELNCYDGERTATVRFRHSTAVNGLLVALYQKHDSVSASDLSDALREEMEGNADAIRMYDMLKATL